ncbi:MAG TPA: hypothetical protein VEQ58_22580 [Polyangiaceae bacterium]|nr:hypothetical protein [Polyangiaceae bacterium]
MQSFGLAKSPAQPRAALLVLLRIALIALPLFALLSPKPAHAYAWMIKRGYPSCPACHADPSGGELLTGYGRMISTLTLSTNWGGSDGAATNQHGLSRKLALRSPESLAAHAKSAGTDDNAEAAKADGAKPADADANKAEGEAKPADSASAGSSDSDADSEEEPPVVVPKANKASDEESTFPNFLFGAFKLPDWLLLGGSYRHMNIFPIGDGKFRTFPMMLDLYGQMKFGGFSVGGSIGGARVAVGSPYARRAQITTNQGKEWNLISRTHYLGYDITPEVTVRAGRLNLPFGVRIPEHTMWVRQATNTDRESSQQHGVAIAYVGDKLRGEVMGIAGNYQMNPDKYRDRGYSGFAEYQFAETATIGVSSLYTFARADRTTLKDLRTMRQVHGVMGRAGFGEKLALLGEVDAIITSRKDLGYVGFLQLDTEFVQGLHFLATAETLDEGQTDPVPGQITPAKVAGQGKPKFGGWLSCAWFIYSHFDVRVDAIKRTGEDVSLLAQLHVYL